MKRDEEDGAEEGGDRGEQTDPPQQRSPLASVVGVRTVPLMSSAPYRPVVLASRPMWHPDLQPTTLLVSDDPVTADWVIEVALGNPMQALLHGAFAAVLPGSPIPAGSSSFQIGIGADWFLEQFAALIALSRSALDAFPQEVGARDERVRAREILDDLEQWEALSRIRRSGGDAAASLDVPQMTWGASVELHSIGRRLRHHRSEHERTVSRATADEIGGGLGSDAVASVTEESASKNRIYKEGSTWRITFAGLTISEPERLGLAYIYELIRRKGQAVNVQELARLGGIVVEQDAQPEDVLDDEGAATLEAKVLELPGLIEAARKEDPEEAARLEEEMEDIRKALGHAVGVGGKWRVTGDPIEAIRSRVGHAIRLELNRLKKSHPALHKHLKSSIKGPSGRQPAYLPTPDVSWTLV